MVLHENRQQPLPSAMRISLLKWPRTTLRPSCGCIWQVLRDECLLPASVGICWRALVLALAEDAEDHNLPLMYWYAAEPLAVEDSGRLLALAEKAKIPLMLLAYSVQRIGAIGTPCEAIVAAARRGARPALADDAQRSLFLTGLNHALAGRRQVAMPADWPAVAAVLAEVRWLRRRHPQPGGLTLGVTFGDASA